jgi:hypothetical protein
VSMLESLVISPWQKHDPERALRADRLARMVFPAVYMTGLALIVLTAR